MRSNAMFGDKMMTEALIFIALISSAAALSCGTCNRENCPTLTCRGGEVDDVCVCCKECAKLIGQSCGGRFNKLGVCDEGLVCELIVEVGESLNADAHGICKAIQRPDDGTSSFPDSSHAFSYDSDCQIQPFSGCNVVDERQCACSEDVQTCINPFQYSSLDECRQAVRSKNDSLPAPTAGDCSQARCEIVFDIKCPADSLKIEAQREEGECCPRPPECLCDMGACHQVFCAEGYQYHVITAGNGRPGSCCDAYECRPISDVSHVTDCHGVICPESTEEMCPSDSKAVMGGTSPDGCCILPSRCTCALERCVIPVCSQGYSPRRIASGIMEPGSCCDVYECVVGIVTEGCRVESHTYVDGESWSDSPCKSCSCKTGWSHCVVQQDCPPLSGTGDASHPSGGVGGTRLCLTRGGIRMPGERWDEDDCTMCECVDGAAACMTSSCVVKCLNPRTVPGICCPVCDTVTNFITMNPIGCPQSNCTTLCAHGYVKDENDCHICECLPASTSEKMTTSSTITTQSTVSSATSETSKQSSTRSSPSSSSTSAPVTYPVAIVCPLIDCPVRCKDGYKIDSNGCSSCECVTEGSVVCEDMSACRRDCPFGLRQDERGCDVCRCQQCRHMDACTKSCLYGYQESRTGCLKCKCRKCPPLADCKKDCTHGFEVNDHGCQICKCQASPVVVVDTRPPVPAAGSCRSVDDQLYDDGETWHDGCRQCYCSNGQEMCGLITCQVPACGKPVIRPGHCCPSCPDSPMPQLPAVLSQVCQSSSGQYYVEGETWLMGPCTSCMCHDGQVLCSPEVCPPLPCLNPVFREGQCCAECDGVLPEPGEEGQEQPGESCSMPGGLSFLQWATWKEDSCTSCQCVRGQPTCYSQTCPPVDCERPLLKKGQCCPTCLDTEIRHICKYGGDIYVDGETWRQDNCTSCVCEDSRVSCTTTQCPELKCSQIVVVAGECCPVCSEGGIVHQTKQPARTPFTDKKDFDATEPAPHPEKPKTFKPLMPNYSLENKGAGPSEPSDAAPPPPVVASKHKPFPVYPVVMSILVILLAVCIVLLLLLFVTKRRHRLLYHVNVKPVEVKGHVAGVKKSTNNRDSIRDSAAFKDNLPGKAGVNNVTLDSQDFKRYSDMFAVGKSIQPV